MTNTLYFLAVVQIAFTGSALAASEAKKRAVPDMAMVKQYVKAQSEIAKDMRSKSPNWAAINAQFKLTLPVIEDIDSQYKTHFTAEIGTALNKCAAGGEEYEINNEIVGKAFQQVTVKAIEQQLDRMGKAKPADMKADAKKIEAYFEVIRPIMARRDKTLFEGKKTLETAAEKAVDKLQTVSKDDLLFASRELEDVMARTYALSVLYEATEIERLRDTNRPLAERHRVEASMYYGIIQSRIEKRNAKTNELMTNMLKGSLSTVDSQAVENYLTTGLGLKLR
jgi:hypothetical protein